MSPPNSARSRAPAPAPSPEHAPSRAPALSPVSDEPDDRIADINRRIGAMLSEYIRENAAGETPPPFVPQEPPKRSKSPSVAVYTPETRRSNVRRRLFASASADKSAPRSI